MRQQNVESSSSVTVTDQPRQQLPEKASPAASPWHPNQYPDGGLRAWTVTAGAFSCVFYSFGIGIFQDYYHAHQLRSYSSSTISWIASLGLFIMFAGGPIVWRINDTYGPRYLILAGTFFHVFGLMMISICKEYYQILLAPGICSAIGTSCLFSPRTNGVEFRWAIRTATIMILGMLISGNLTLFEITPQPQGAETGAVFAPFKERTYLSAMQPYFGRVLPGWIDDKIVTCLFSRINDLALWTPAKQSAPLIVFAALYGSGSGAFVSLLPVIIAQISDVREVELRLGMEFAVMSVAALVSNPMEGTLVDHDHDAFRDLQIFLRRCASCGECWVYHGKAVAGEENFWVRSRRLQSQ
ncbi:uncharacterized protein BDV17DRAFT_281405 [Aspergillus undulatus]|uniref:uncharacterized protein n=1 Tax=Aspergillus undulatus TaxID=1810928 RepID=UPI003CCE1589